MLDKIIGVIGGGQLGRMLCNSGNELGFTMAVYCPDIEAPAFSACKYSFNFSYNDREKLKEFAELCDYITYEFENIPSDSIDILNDYSNVYPSKELLEISQNRLKEKKFFNDLGLATAGYQAIFNSKELGGKVGILKTCRFGYDGRGQWHINSDSDIPDIADGEYILEEKISFDKEVSSIISRNKKGEMVVYPIGENIHNNGILHKTILPANISKQLQDSIIEATKKIAEHIDLIGVLAIELFIKGDEFLINEMAPRPHNSGHWTQDGCDTSQFEQLIRAISGMDFGDIKLRRNIKMINLIGDDIYQISQISKGKNAKLHLYGKKQVKKGRKMGHINILE